MIRKVAMIFQVQLHSYIGILRKKLLPNVPVVFLETVIGLAEMTGKTKIFTCQGF